MIVGLGNNNVLLIGLVEKDIEELHRGFTHTYENPPHGPFLTRDIVIVWGRDKAHLLELLNAAGVDCSEPMAADYLAGKRTDKPRRPM